MGNVEWLSRGEGLPDADNPKAWVTVSEAALIVERDRKTVEDAIRKHAIPVRPGRNLHNQPTKFLHRPTLEDKFGISKGDVVGHAGHLEVMKGEKEGDDGVTGNEGEAAVGRFDLGGARDVTRYGEIAQRLDTLLTALEALPAITERLDALTRAVEAGQGSEPPAHVTELQASVTALTTAVDALTTEQVERRAAAAEARAQERPSLLGRLFRRRDAGT